MARAAQDAMVAAVLASTEATMKKARGAIYKLALSKEMVSISMVWQQWRCVKLTSATICTAVDAAVELDDDGANAELCFAAGEVLVAMAAVWKARNELMLDTALEVIARNHKIVARVAKGELLGACRQRLASADRNPHNAILKKLCAPLLAIDAQTTQSVFGAIATHGGAYTLHKARREALLEDAEAA